ncbi:MAG: anaerobic carbon-monoxide dehydrogenase catalytic subunit [Deltaproteobacteria bacterium]|nr:anaerobic carbon-monoxide dehydrogenase catalytic subunit [Deltaproteobacteria bacterium]
MSKKHEVFEQNHQDIQSHEIHQAAVSQGMSTVFERFRAQQPQCGHCKKGVSCQLCSDGPCRINKKAPMGVCGAGGDLIVARNLLQLAIMGTAANSYQCRNLANTLKAIGEGKSSLQVKDEVKLRMMCQGLGVDHTKPINELAVEFADFMLNEISKADNQPLALMDLFAVTQRKEVWKNKDLYASGPSAEILTALTKCMTNVNNDPVDLIKTALRLGIANEYAALWGITVLQDIIMGTAALVSGETNIACLDPQTVNIIANGHQPVFASLVLEKAGSKKFQSAATTAGAAGIKLYGSLCEGQQLMNVSSREEYTNTFGGQLGNWIQEELFIATGLVDLFMMDMNCSVPTLKVFADKYGTKLITTDPAVRFPDVDHLDFDPEIAEQQAEQILETAVECFKERKADTKRIVNIPSSKTKTECIAGYTTETVLKMFGNDIHTYINEMKKGNIKGAVAVAGCTNVRHEMGGRSIQETTMELIKRDIMVIGAGCCSSTHQNTGMSTMAMTKKAGSKLRAVCEKHDVPPIVSYGSCTDVGKILDTVAALAWTIGCDTSQLPVAASVPEWMEQKAIADIFTTLAFGLLTHVSPKPMISGSPLVTKYLTEDLESLTGGKMLLEDDPVKAAEMIELHIMEKRKEIGFD